MGGKQSINNSTEILNEMLSSTVLKYMNECKMMADLSQVVTFVCNPTREQIRAYADSKGCQTCLTQSGSRAECKDFCTFPCSLKNLRQEGVFRFSNDCKISQSAVQRMQADLMNQLDQKMKNQEDALGKALVQLTNIGGDSDVSNTAIIRNSVAQMLTVDSINSIVSEMTVEQRVSASGGNIDGVTQTVAADMIQSSLTESSAGQELTVAVSNAARQSLENELSGPFSTLTNAAKFLSGAFVIVGGIVVIGLVGTGKLGSVFGGGGGGGDDDYDDEDE